MFAKKSKKKAEEILKDLYSDLAVIDDNLKRAESIQKNIKIRLDNSIDDSIKVKRAFNNAKAQGAYSDASILEIKLNEIENDHASYLRDYHKISSSVDHFRSIRNELMNNIESIRARENDVNLTYEAARMQQLSNIAYSDSKTVHSAYSQRKEEAQKEFDTAVSMQELDLDRVSDNLAQKYEV